MQLDSSETELRIKSYDQKKFEFEFEQISNLKVAKS